MINVILRQRSSLKAQLGLARSITDVHVIGHSVRDTGTGVLFACARLLTTLRSPRPRATPQDGMVYGT